MCYLLLASSYSSYIWLHKVSSFKLKSTFVNSGSCNIALPQTLISQTLKDFDLETWTSEDEATNTGLGRYGHHCNYVVSLPTICPSLGSNTNMVLLPPSQHVSFSLNFFLVFENRYMSLCLSIISAPSVSLLPPRPLTIGLQQGFPSFSLNSLSLSLSSCLLGW